jgi:hypothetical protein
MSTAVLAEAYSMHLDRWLIGCCTTGWYGQATARSERTFKPCLEIANDERYAPRCNRQSVRGLRLFDIGLV